MTGCPKCGADNAKGETRCAKCGAALLAGEVPHDHAEPEEFSTVCVRMFRGPTARMEADLARNVLEENGIPCVLPGEVTAEVLPGLDVVQLLVRQEDAGEATEILKDFFDSPHPLPNEEPSV